LTTHPSSAEAVLSKSKVERVGKSGSDGMDATTPISGYVVTYGNQKRFSNPNAEASTTIPFLSTKLQQHAITGNLGGGRMR
jgi:hypothetical protein